jgi:capsular exopolysaccharide synthesis family protein
MDPKSLELRDYLSIMWARKWIIAAIAATTVAAALAYSFRQTPVYTSSAEVLVLSASLDPTVSSAASIPPNMVKEQQVANSAAVKQRASVHLAHLGITRGRMSATQVEGAETLVFSSVSADRRAAQETTRAYMQAYLELRRSDLVDELEGAREPYESRIQAIDAELQGIIRLLPEAQGETQALLNARYSVLLSERASYLTKLNELADPGNVRVGRVLRAAALPRSPSAPNHIRDGLLGLLVGLAFGIGVAFLKDRLDERVRGPQELEFISGTRVLAFIPRANPKRGELLVRLSRPTSEAAEAFNSLAVMLLHLIGDETRSVVITSSLAGEGKTSVTANLGATLALAGNRVVIMSADLRRPRLQSYFPDSGFPTSDGAGLTEVLRGKRNLMEVLSTTGTENLWVLHAGARGDLSAPTELLGSQSMFDLLAELYNFADLVLIDTPPLLATSDVVALSPLVDGVLFVVDPSLSQRSTLERARHELEFLEEPVFGVVVNRHDPRRFRAYGSGYSYYGENRDQRSAASGQDLLPR